MNKQIDVFIPYHSKDYHVLPWSINGIRNHVDHRSIYVISNQENRSYIDSLGADFVDENKIIRGLANQSFQGDRWGWYFQQILKLAMADFVDGDYFLVVDADTVFLRDTTFFNEENKPYYVPAKEYHPPYFEKFHQLFGYQAKREYSFISHHMIFSKSILTEMLSQIGKEKDWYVNILEGLNFSSADKVESGFSEYETYGHYLKAHHPEEVNLRKLKREDVPLRPNEFIISRLSRVYDYCNFHHYKLSAPRSIRGVIKRAKTILKWSRIIYGMNN